MAIQDVLNSAVVAQFILPFTLIFFILFAVLEKTKILGGDKHALNVWTSAVISLIFVSAVFPKQVVANLMLFLVIAMVVIFVVLILWGFVNNGEAKIDGNVMKLTGIVIVIIVIIAVFWAAGLRLEFLNKLIEFLFYSNWSKDFWTNAAFLGFVAIAIALTWFGAKGSS